MINILIRIQKKATALEHYFPPHKWDIKKIKLYKKGKSEKKTANMGPL